MNYYTDIPIEPKEKRRILVTFLLASLALLMLGTMLYGQYKDLNISRESVRGTYVTLLQTKDMFSSLQDLETGQRGYLLTGNQAFLKPYYEANAKIDKEMNALEQRIKQNPQRLEQLKEFRQVVSEQRSILKAQIDGRNKDMLNVVLTSKEAEISKAIMDHLRSLTNRMLQDEELLLSQRYEVERQRRDSYTRMLLASVLISLLGLIVSNGLIVRTGLKRRKIEVALEHSQKFSDSIVDSSSDCIKLLDIDGEILSVNDAGCKLLELNDKSQLLGKSWANNWAGKYRTMAKQAMEEARAGKLSHFEGEAETFKGNNRWWEVIVTPVMDMNKQVYRLLAISRDITDRYLAQQVIAENEKRFRQLADTLPQMVWSARPDGVREYFNRRWYDYTGMPFGTTEGWEKLVHPEDHDRLVALWKHCVATGEPYEIEYRLRRADGVYCWTLGRALPIRDDKGVITKWYGTSTVIEEQKRKEKELQEAKEIAELANQAKSEFLANMSHEIRTPMNAVVGLSNLLQNSNLTAEKRKEFIRTIQLSAQQLMELINDLLDVTKLDSGNVELEKISFNLAELLEEIISVMGVKAREKNIELIVRYTPELNGNFIGDPLRLRQVLMNLVSNAIKFTEKGMVTLQADHCPDDKTGNWNICFDVIDTGIGIPANKIDTVFSKFSQADTSITRKYGGTGLGLSICKTLVALMGGKITVMSTVGLGSKFTAHVPLKPADGAPVKFKNRKMTSGISKNVEALPPDEQPLVLLVEDYKANVLVATQTIEDCGYRWELAEDGLQALEKVKSGRYDAILMDVQMPKMDGMTATAKIREWEKKNGKERTPILGITAYSMEGDRDKCIRSGMDDYLSKPFDPEDLKEKIRVLTKGKRI